MHCREANAAHSTQCKYDALHSGPPVYRAKFKTRTSLRRHSSQRWTAMNHLPMVSVTTGRTLPEWTTASAAADVRRPRRGRPCGPPSPVHGVRAPAPRLRGLRTRQPASRA